MASTINDLSMIAPNGQAYEQAPHEMHFSGLISAFFSSFMWMAPTLQLRRTDERAR